MFSLCNLTVYETNVVEQREQLDVELAETREEESGEDGNLKEVLTDDGKMDKSALKNRIRELKKMKPLPEGYADEYAALTSYQSKLTQYDALGKQIREKQKALDEAVKAKYAALTVDEIKRLLFDEKWMPKLRSDISGEIDRMMNSYVSRVLLIARRYEHTLGEMEKRTAESGAAVRDALERMGYTW